MDKAILFAGVYGFMQLEMRSTELLLSNGKWYKRKSHMSESERDAVFIYEWIEDQLRQYNIAEIQLNARVIDNMVKKLVNEDKFVNNFLLGVYLLRNYVDDYGSKMDHILLLPKIHRLMFFLDEQKFDMKIRKATSRVANNIFRQWAGKPQLSDEVRDAVFKRITHAVS